MRKLTKEDFIIYQVDKNKFILRYREKFLYFFSKWLPVTYLHLGQEHIMEFKELDEVKSFIQAIIE